MDSDKTSDDGIILSKPGSDRFSVIEAFKFAREFDSMPPRDEPPRQPKTPPTPGAIKPFDSGGKRCRSSGRSSSRRRERLRECSLHSNQDSDPGNFKEQRDMFNSFIGFAKNATKPQGNQCQDVEASLAERFDLAMFARAKLSGDHSGLDLQWFADPALILTLKKDIDLCRRMGCWVPHVSKTCVESLQPQWLGEGKLEGDRDRIVKDRKKGSPQSSTSVCISSIGFWMANLATGQIEVTHVLAHAFFMIELCDERGHMFAAKYQSRFRNCFQIRIQAGEHFDLGEAVSKINYDFIREVQVEETFTEEDRSRRRRWEDDPPPRGYGKGERGGSGKGDRGGGKADLKGGGTRAPKGSATDTPKHIEKKNICFYHNPVKDIICQRGDDCMNEHLDTALPGNLDRFNGAKKRFDEMKLSSKKHAGKE